MNVTMWENYISDRFLDVAKFTTLTPLSLLILCKLSFPIVGLKMSSLPTLALKSPNKTDCTQFLLPSFSKQVISKQHDGQGTTASAGQKQVN
jgi:hypothetical protein